MGFFDKLKELVHTQNKIIGSGEFYENAGVLEPFTVLENGQMRVFIGDMSNNKSLREDEKKAFKAFWYAIAPDIEGFGNNIWNLKEGAFTIYEKEDIKVMYNKMSSKTIDKFTDEGRVTFTYKSNEGDLVVHQNERNNKIFLIYVSEKTSQRLFDIFREVETEILELKNDNTMSKYKLDVSNMKLEDNKKIIIENDERER